jgi:hypothetical protein
MTSTIVCSRCGEEKPPLSPPPIPGALGTRETTGTGIGLALVRQLARAMRGDVDVLNREPGAEFVLTLPALPVESRAAG